MSYNLRIGDYIAYPASVYYPVGGGVIMMARRESESGEDFIISSPPASASFVGESRDFDGELWTIARLTHENAVALRKWVPHTVPRPVLREARSFGLGDRLGLAGEGHLRAIETTDAYPVLAQQSIRELNLTGRTYDNVLDAASFAVFRHGFTRGFGADGDHLKTREDIEYALGLGFSMITLDCSEHIRTLDKNSALPPISDELRELYLDREFALGETRIAFTETSLRECAYVYGGAIDFAARIYDEYIADRADSVDFEISIDETHTPTTPAQHYFIAHELARRGVKPQSVAPKFCGEFQKGIDYIGDIAHFEREILAHADIAREFGYKLSVHSGSDKFAVFALVGKCTRGRFHVKTAGTSWLVAMRLVAERDAPLYRAVHAYALKHFDEARQYYSVTTDISRIPDITTLTDAQLGGLFELADARQLIHITYGLILSAKDASGASLFRDRLYALWERERESYAERLREHIGHHLELLYSEI